MLFKKVCIFRYAEFLQMQYLLHEILSNGSTYIK